MNVFGGDKGEGGVWLIDAGKVPTRYLAVKPRETGIHTTLHVVSNNGQEVSLFLEEVTGLDVQFDGEVDAEAGAASSSSVIPEVQWVPAQEAASCRVQTESLKRDLAETAQKAQDKAAATIATYQAQYPRQLFFGYEWDEAKAAKLGFEKAWSDDKFTYSARTGCWRSMRSTKTAKRA